MLKRLIALSLIAATAPAWPSYAAPEATIRRAPPASVATICSNLSWADDAAEILVADNGRKIASLPVCLPYGDARDLKLVQDANGKAYVFLVKTAYRGSPSQSMLTIYRLDGGDLREIFSTYMDWPLASSQFFAYDYTVERNASGGLRISFRGRVEGESDADNKWDDPPEHKNMTITIEETD